MQGFLTNLVIFIVMALGWLMKRSGKLTDAGLKDMNALLFSLLMPVSFFKAGAGFDASMLHGWRYATVLLSAYVAFSVLVWMLTGIFHKEPKRRAVSILASIRPNSVFIGIPILSLWMGSLGAEAQLIYIAVCMPYFNVVPLFLANVSMSGKVSLRSLGHSFCNTFKNPILLAGIFGLICGALGWTPLIPQWIMRTVKVIGDCGNGLSLIVIGAALAPERLLDDIKAAWPDMLLKLFIHPAVIMVAFLLFPLENPVLMQCAVVSSAIAPAFNCYVLARGFGMDSDYAAMVVASSTLLCMATLLFWMELATRVFA